MLPLPFRPDSAEGGNGAHSSNGPYQARRRQHPWAERGGRSDRCECEKDTERERERERGRGGRDAGEGRRGEERWGWEKPKPHLVSWFETGVYPCWNKDCLPSSVPALPLNPQQHALYHIHTHGRERFRHTHTVTDAHTHIHTHTSVFCIIEKKYKEWSRRWRGREMINKWPIICSVTQLGKNSCMQEFHWQSKHINRK